MRELRGMTKTLRHLAEHCQGNDRPHCPIIEDLSSGHQAASDKPAKHSKHRKSDSPRHRQAF
jgi:MerR family transcriptional regulator, copper efflux regulator